MVRHAPYAGLRASGFGLRASGFGLRTGIERDALASGERFVLVTHGIPLTPRLSGVAARVGFDAQSMLRDAAGFVRCAGDVATP
jgi:hypothetical protein